MTADIAETQGQGLNFPLVGDEDRAVFVIGPDKNAVSTPVNWTDGDDVIISPASPDDEATARFPKGFTTLKPYLRLTPQPDH